MEIVYHIGTGRISAWGESDLSGNIPPGHNRIVRPGFSQKAGKFLNDYIVTDKGGGDEVFLKDYLELSVDAVSTVEPHDGVPDILGDGVSTTTVTIQKMDGEAETPLTGVQDNEAVYLETSGGRLAAESASLANGQATVVLTSSTETIVIALHAWNPQETLRDGTIRVQFRA